MAYDTMIAEVYCPKCKQTFEEGSRRFCPTDGARLISDSVDAHGGDTYGIFSGLVPKTEAKINIAHTEHAEDVPTFVISEPEIDLFDELKAPETDSSNSFFELDDLDIGIKPVERSAPVVKAAAPFMVDPFEPAKPIGRKVNPNEIPAGHVDLGDSERTAAGIFNDFDIDAPEKFVSRTVKGRYKVLDYLGGDDTGLAYLADDRIVKDKKVLVRILLEDDSDPIMNSILDEERVSLSHFSHPNVARMIDSGAFTDGTEFLVTEYTEGLSIRDILSIHGAFPAKRAARLIRQASYALSEAHQQGIIHRDMRPGNIILSLNDADAEHIKVVNLGASSGEPNEYNLVYKAPEVLDGRIPTVSSDIYSLAVVAYEMLTGATPYNGNTAKEIVRLQYAGLNDEQISSSEFPNTVNEVFEKALSFKAAGRYTRARDFGDALFSAVSETKGPEVNKEISTPIVPSAAVATAANAVPERKVEIIKPLETRPAPTPVEPAWKNRSPEPPQEENSSSRVYALLGILTLVALLAFGWYYLVNHPTDPARVDQNAVQNTNEPSTPTISSDTEMPPLARKITQPPNTEYYSSTKQNLKGDLLRNFVGFSLYYPKEWKLNAPQESTTVGTRGKFLDISRSTPDGRLKEQMLVSYYPSKGTYGADTEKFPTMVKETNDTLKRILPGYQVVSEGEIKVNGDWRAYEVKFQSSGTSDSGERLIVWGRRIFVPAARPGARNGFEITMLATSLADEVRSVDDVGVKGELAPVLYSFEPTQNF